PWPRIENRFIMITRSILGPRGSPTMGAMAPFPTEGSGGGLLRNTYPAFAYAARDRLQFRVHLEFRQDVLDVGPHGVGRHPQNRGDFFVILPERQLAQHLELPLGEWRGRPGLILLLEAMEQAGQHIRSDQRL